MIQDDYIPFEIGRTKRIALIAHDGKKQDLIKWVQKNEDLLKSHFLCGTGTTAKLLCEQTDLPVKGYNSGPLGGDLQIGSRIVEGSIDLVIFLWDPLESQPHDPDVKALLRIAAVYDIPVANNLSTADFMITSSFMNQVYTRQVENYNKVIQNRVEKFLK